ncbi:hypothetical protein [Neobacillus sp. DY30]|uniref:hypothetical protein n=1 Tax=Neobacillus sp. DY30 TaxID=3047871 RepID=UPI0024BF7EDF|nr:hypothetical protein [Neobacillus sp. DY30]WHY03333.1 hypothetical protein QNH29_14390 [Neobacillus sp. DY30]
MYRKKAKNYLTFILLILLFALTACTQSPDFELYGGKPLKIAVVGEAPEVNEEQVIFTEISFDGMTSEVLKSYDAVFIRENNLSEAAESQYADVYLNSSIPFFFISANNHIPFTVKETAYNESWNWTAGQSYAVGILTLTEDDSLKSWKYGLYNDKKTDEHIKEVYSRIFKTIDELNQ